MDNARHLPEETTEYGTETSPGSIPGGTPEFGLSGERPLTGGRPARRDRQPKPATADFFYTVFWLLCCAAFVIGLWHLGPLVAERYQFALSSGKAKAEYVNASRILESDPLASLSMASELIAQRIRPSVVSIECEKLVTQGRRGLGWAGGQGSGVVIESNGLILTNAHVVEGSRHVIVTLHDHRRLQAQIVGVDNENDLAVLKIEATGLIPAVWGDSEKLRVGSMVWAIGSPYGLEQTVTSGIISGKNRYGQDPNSRSATQELIQTDAAVNKGNSGGPLVDSRGNVIGINTSILGDQFQGISFAIPGSVAKFISSQLVSTGTVSLGFLGIEPGPITEQAAERMGLADLYGALIGRVTPDTPAARAGLMEGDIIRKWNGIPIDDYKMVFRLVQTTKPGTSAEVEVLRDGKSLSIRIEVMSRPSL